MQTVSNGTKQSTIITGMRILQGEGVKGFYHGVSRVADSRKQLLDLLCSLIANWIPVNLN